MLTFDEYQKMAYIAIQDHASNKEEVMHWAIGLGEEAGEVLSVIKHRYYGGQYSVEDVLAELGDTLWHIAALCTALGLDMRDVVDYNFAKLRYRYPTGQFDEERSKSRHELEVGFRDSDTCGQIVSEVLAKLKKRKLEETENGKFYGSDGQGF